MTYFDCLKRAFDFSSRAMRKEYWLFILGRIVLFAALLTIYGLYTLGSVQQLEAANFSLGDGGVMAVLAIVGGAILFWDFIAGVSLTARRLNDLEWPIYLVAATFIPYINIAFMVFLGFMKGKPRSSEKIEILTRLLDEIHDFIVSQGYREDLLLFPCPDYGKEVAELAVMKIVDSGMYEASFSDGCFAIKSISKAAA